MSPERAPLIPTPKARISTQALWLTSVCFTPPKPREYNMHEDSCGTPKEFWLRKPEAEGNRKYCPGCERVGKLSKGCLKCHKPFKASCRNRFLCKGCRNSNDRQLED